VSSDVHARTHGSHKRTFTSEREGGRVKRPDDDPIVEGVYDRLKNRLLGQRLVPGQLLQIGPLAEELGVSTTPVREALTRLAAERLIISTPKKGFFAKTPTEDEIHGLYCVNQTLLDSALSRWSKRDQEMAQRPVVSSPAQQLNADQWVHATAQLFLRIAGRSGIGEIAQIVSNMNDRLHHPRLIESEVIEDAGSELAQLDDLYAAGRRDELKLAIKGYHERRWRLVSTICKELLVRSFLSAERKVEPEQ
jgi:DNA-binding GntR family transcriptional regulator